MHLHAYAQTTESSNLFFSRIGDTLDLKTAQMHLRCRPLVGKPPTARKKAVPEIQKVFCKRKVIYWLIEAHKSLVFAHQTIRFGFEPWGKHRLLASRFRTKRQAGICYTRTDPPSPGKGYCLRLNQLMGQTRIGSTLSIRRQISL